MSQGPTYVYAGGLAGDALAFASLRFSITSSHGQGQTIKQILVSLVLLLFSRNCSVLFGKSWAHFLDAAKQGQIIIV